MNTRKLVILLTVVFILVASVCFAGEEIVENGIVYITNTDVPSQGIETLKLNELWRIGGEDEEFIFRSINKVLLGHDGNYYVLDGLSGVIYIVDAQNGQQIRQININGEGPGELSFAKDMSLIENNQIALLRSHPAKMVCIDYQGIPQPNVDLSGDSFFIAGAADWYNGVLVIAGSSANIHRGETYIARYDYHGEMYRYENYFTRSSPSQRKIMEEDDYFMVNKPWSISQSGELYLAPYWSLPNKGYYLINVYDKTGKLVRVITRKFKAYKRSRKEKQLVKLRKFCGKDGLRRLEDIGFEYLVETYDPDIINIYRYSDGNIWISTSRSIRDQKLSYDVFSSQGHFIKQVLLEGDENGQKDIIYFIDQNRIILVKGQLDIKFGCKMSADADILEIICYSIIK